MADYIISSHGGRWSDQQRNLVVPAGSRVVFYVRDGGLLPNVAGYRLLGELQGGVVNQGEIVQTVSAGQQTFDYSAWYAPEFAAACGIYQVGSQVRVASLQNYDENNPILLSQIFAAYPNSTIYWLACRETSDRAQGTSLRVSPHSYLTEPPPQPEDDPSEIPGGSVLGFGFNALGSYDLSSLTQQIFMHQTTAKSTWTYAPTGITYNVPDNTSVIPNTNVNGSAQVFDTRQQFQNYFAAQADISASYGAFSAEFNSAYSQTLNSDQSYYYCLYNSNFTGWNLALSDQTNTWVSPSFTNDPDVKALPTSFTMANQEQFYAVFRKFGTHFVTQVTVGGSLNYYLAVEKSFSSNDSTIEANVSLEYDALFVSASAKSSMEWSQLGQNWASSRVVKVSSVGGNTSILNSLDPQFGDSDSSVFSSWSNGVMQNPAVTEFQLRPLNVLFSGDQAIAVSQALQAYMNGAILATANADFTPSTGPGGGNFTTSSLVMVNGTSFCPVPTEPVPQPHTAYGHVWPIGGYQVAIIDPASLESILSYIYYQDNTSMASEAQVYSDMMADIAEITHPNYLAVVSGFAIDLMNYPSAAFAQWLESCGAAMDGWRQWIGFTGSPGIVSYTMIGQKGLMPGRAQESFAAATDWIDRPWESTCDVASLLLLYGDVPSTNIAKRRSSGSRRGWKTLKSR